MCISARARATPRRGGTRSTARPPPAGVCRRERRPCRPGVPLREEVGHAWRLQPRVARPSAQGRLASSRWLPLSGRRPQPTDPATSAEGRHAPRARLPECLLLRHRNRSAAAGLDVPPSDHLDGDDVRRAENSRRSAESCGTLGLGRAFSRSANRPGAVVGGMRDTDRVLRPRPAAPREAGERHEYCLGSRIGRAWLAQGESRGRSLSGRALRRRT